MTTWKRKIEGFQDLFMRTELGLIDEAEARDKLIDLLMQQPEWNVDMTFTDTVNDMKDHKGDPELFDEDLEELYDWADEVRVWLGH